MTTDPKNIQELLNGKLPGLESLRDIRPYCRSMKPPEGENHVKRSSVLLLLFTENNLLKCCLIKRPLFMKHHAGQIALPGGQIEDKETAEETALRETNEEIGIPSDKINILGRLSSFYVEVSRFLIIPIVGWINEKPIFSVNPSEVEKTIIFPVEKLKPPYSTSQKQIFGEELTVPCIKYDNEIIWGATAMILSEFYNLIDHKNEFNQSHAVNYKTTMLPPIGK